MAQERALQITFIDGKYGFSSFPYPDAMKAFADGLKDRVAPARTFQIYSNFGRIRVGRNGVYTPEQTEELKFEGVVRDDDFNGEPSEETAKKMRDISAVPVIEVYSKSGDVRVFYPIQYAVKEPLTGRIYEVFKSDCWSLCREYLTDRLGIYMPTGTLQTSLDLQERLGRNFMLEICKEIGFKEVLIPQQNDIIVMGAVTLHTGIYIDGGKILHLFPGRLSAIESYDGWLEANTISILRHEGVKS